MPEDRWRPRAAVLARALLYALAIVTLVLATELQDIMLGTPVPITGKVNLGILKTDAVNIIVHGHEPLARSVRVSD